VSLIFLTLLYLYVVEEITDDDPFEHKFGPDTYDVGKVVNSWRDNEEKRGYYSVASGETINRKDSYEFQPHTCLNETQWYAIRSGPTYDRHGSTTTRRGGNVLIHTMEAFDTKQEAVAYLRDTIEFCWEFNGQ
jgi:hypothetical protein